MTTQSATSESTPRAKSTARLHAVQAVYQMLLTGQGAETVIDDFLVHRMAGAEPEMHELARPEGNLFRAIVMGVEKYRDDLVTVIGNHLKEGTDGASWGEREPLLFALLLCGGYELMAHTDIDAPIIISDYLDISHAYYTGREPAMVNGVLDALRVTYRG